MDNLDFSPEAALLAFEQTYDPNSHNRLSYLTPATTWPLPSALDSHGPSSMPADADPSATLRRVNTTAESSSALPITTTAPPLQTSGLSFPSHIDPTAAMLTQTADWKADWAAFPPMGQQQQSQQQQQQQQQQPQQQQQQSQQQQQASFIQDGTIDPSAFDSSFGAPLQTSPIDFSMPQTTMTTLSMDAASSAWTTSPAMDNLNAIIPFEMNNFQQQLMSFAMGNDAVSSGDFVASSVGTGSPSENLMEIRSLSSSDNGWSAIDFPQSSRRSFDMMSDGSNVIIFNPNQTLHVRTDSDSSHHSDVPPSAHSFSSYDEGVFPLHSPQSEDNLDFSTQQITQLPPSLTGVYMGSEHDSHSTHSHSSNHSPIQYTVSPAAISEPLHINTPAPVALAPSVSTSPSSSGSSSPPARQKKSPVNKSSMDKVTKTIQKKPAHTTKKDVVTEKKVGRRRGPLRPDQRQQAHEIRKLRACLRCKFLKKTCDKGDPCAGCQPSHARLWQVPCTRIDIKDIAYFMKDWKADYERHVSLGFSVGNIKGFSQIERRIYITHGYGFYLPINAREVYVRDEKCFGVDWVESIHETPKAFETNTAKLSAGMEGISHSILSEYLDRHIDGGFERFVDEYFEGTYFLTEILKTAYRFYVREKSPVIRKALKLVLAYNLTLHVTMVEGLDEAEANIGRVEDTESKFWGKTVAPVMINFQVKCALADMWRELQKDVLEELSALYSSVYSGDKLKNWPTIFMLASILLAVWELMQFDCHYRVPDEKAVKKFCDDMESTPVGVIVGLFSAISQKLPSFFEWDTRKHHHLLNSNPAVCDAMTEVRAHVHKYGKCHITSQIETVTDEYSTETYLKSRADTKFNRDDFDSLSNKFLSKLVIRAN
jgi:hypothetical protein